MSNISRAEAQRGGSCGHGVNGISLGRDAYPKPGHWHQASSLAFGYSMDLEQYIEISH
jgi:hypothetical protein